jgi:hypothetical protein
MCVCVCVCEYICSYCVCVCMHACVCVCVCVCIERELFICVKRDLKTPSNTRQSGVVEMFLEYHLL